MLAYKHIREKRKYLMRETLWIFLPKKEAEDVKRILNFINEKKLSALSVKQLLQKLIDNQADHWRQALVQYNNIASVRIDLSKLLVRTLDVNNQFLRHQEKLENKLFKPNELISLIILCYSDPNLIGQKLCKALQDNNNKGIAKQILENSAYVKTQGRVVPKLSNLRLLNYAFYANDTSVQLPNAVRNRIRRGAIEKGITLLEVGQFTYINSTYWATHSSFLNHTANTISFEQWKVESFSYPAISSEKSTSATNSGNNNNISRLLAVGLVGFYVFKNLPVVGQVACNVGKDIRNVTNHIGNFFSMKHTEYLRQVEKKPCLFLSLLINSLFVNKFVILKLIILIILLLFVNKHLAC